MGETNDIRYNLLGEVEDLVEEVDRIGSGEDSEVADSLVNLARSISTRDVIGVENVLKEYRRICSNLSPAFAETIEKIYKLRIMDLAKKAEYFDA